MAGTSYTASDGLPTSLAAWDMRCGRNSDCGRYITHGLMYGKGQGVPQDYAQAAAWYRKAAEQGDAGAQHNLGYAYDFGQGVTQDDAQAVAWYRKAAEQGLWPLRPERHGPARL